MAYISPNSTIKILRNIPLDNSYEHTIYFASLSDQTRYFSSNSFVKYTLTEQSYQRVKRGYIRVEIPSDNLYDCNYVAFQNTNFGNKWFYAFIKSVEYINNAVSEIEFEIDVLQTWHFDYQLGRCFVLRSHTTTDVIGENIEPEPVDIGEYQFNNYSPIFTGELDLTDMSIIVCIAEIDDEDVNKHGKVYDGIFGGTVMYAFTTSQITELNDFLSDYYAKPDAIVAMYMCPSIIVPPVAQDYSIPSGSQGTFLRSYITPLSSPYPSLDGYTPNNKKLYTYPYNFYHIDNASGGEMNLRYEFFNNLAPIVELNGVFTQPVKLILRPAGYKGLSSGGELTPPTVLNTESISLENYPLCSWAFDAYQAWIAQNSIPVGIDALKVIGSLAGGPALGPIGSAYSVAQGFDLISNFMKQGYQASISANLTGGSLNNGNANTSTKKQQFYGGRVCCEYTYARKIDEFFSMYGYAINRLIAPNRVARPYWTYLKLGTVDLLGTTGVPSNDSEKIVSIYKNGITWWKYFSTQNTAYVGRYDLDNNV